MKYKHKKLWRIAEKRNWEDWLHFGIVINWKKEGFHDWNIISKELIEDSNDWEPIQEKERTMDWLWIGRNIKNIEEYYPVSITRSFENIEQWQLYLKKQQARYEIKKRQSLNDDFEPDWEAKNKQKYYVYYLHYNVVNINILVDHCFCNQEHEFYFSSAEKAQQFINECGSNFLIYYWVKW